MNIWSFLNDSPFVVVIVCVLVALIVALAAYGGLCALLAHLNIRKHGWPPAGRNANGDPAEWADEEPPHDPRS